MFIGRPDDSPEGRDTRNLIFCQGKSIFGLFLGNFFTKAQCPVWMNLGKFHFVLGADFFKILNDNQCTRAMLVITKATCHDTEAFI